MAEEDESALLRAAFDAAADYIHGGQDRGSESQARYTAWIEARDAVRRATKPALPCSCLLRMHDRCTDLDCECPRHPETVKVNREAPSYHDLHITTKDIERTSIFDLPYGFEVSCTRTTGWTLYDHGTRMSPHLKEQQARLIAGEYIGGEKWLVLDVNGTVIVDVRRVRPDEPSTTSVES